MITQATEEQWKQIEQVKESWLTEKQVAQYSDQEMREAFKGVMPEVDNLIFIVDSPLEARLFSWAMSLLSQSKDQLSNQLDRQLGDQLDDQLRDQLDSQLDRQLGDQLDDQLRDQLDSQLHRQLRDQLRDQLSSQLHSQLHNQLDDQLSSQLHSQLSDQLNGQKLNSYCGVWWGTWAGYYEGASKLGVNFDRDVIETFMAFVLKIPIVMWDDHCVYLLRRPKTIHWEEERLHNNKGPSVQFTEGFGLWNIDGVSVDEQIVMRPETQTLEQIEQEQDNDVKSIRIERFGWARYIKESKAKVIDTQTNAIENTQESIFELNDGRRRFVATCPSGKHVSLSIPRGVDTCEQAQNWMSPFNNSNCIGRT